MLCKLKNILLVLFFFNSVELIDNSEFTALSVHSHLECLKKSNEEGFSVPCCPKIGQDAREVDIQVTDTLDPWE